ncbi:MAG: MBL fold metallo-hydrolase [Dehalococcoidia bacterium]|nr:MBL fold metallo-hydrolase [Dehalococcoidia bacterium]
MNRLKTAFTFLLALWLLFLPACDFGVTTTPQSVELRVYFIDVGQGDAILIDFGETEILIDGGERNKGVADFIRHYVDGKLEMVIATHPHADHIGGLMEVLQEYDVADIWWNGEDYNSQTYRNFMALVDAEGAGVHVAQSGDIMQLGELTLCIYNPGQMSHRNPNDYSIVLSLQYGEIIFLFAGDAEKDAEADFLTMLPDVDILKLGHHGSRTSSSADFLAMIRPEVAIYSAGLGNSYGHPHQETINALNAMGVRIYGTDTLGTIVAVTDGKTYSVGPLR